MRWRWLLLIVAGLAAVPAARAQLGTAAPGGAPVPLAQFQPGIVPGGGRFGLLPGGSVQIALYCADLFGDTPNERVAFRATTAGGAVQLANGDRASIADAMSAGLLFMRGSGLRDPGARPAGLWFNTVLTNTSDQPLMVSLPVGAVFSPAGQTPPDVGPGVTRLFAAARAQGLLGSDTLAEAVWATRGFSREDVEETGIHRLTDFEAARVQALLASANLGYVFDDARGDYARLYAEKRAALGRAAARTEGTTRFPNGTRAHIEALSDDAGHAVVALTPEKQNAPLYYAGQVIARRPDRLQITLLHLKTGRPLEAARAPLIVRTTETAYHRDTETQRGKA